MSTKETAAASASCDGCLEWGTIEHEFDNDEDFSSCEVEPRQINKSGCWSKGHKDHLGSPDDCEALCAQTDGCVAFDYSHNLFNKRCHLCDSVQNSDVDCPDGETCKTWGIIHEEKAYEEPKLLSYRFNAWVTADLGKKKQYMCFKDCIEGCKQTDGCKSAAFNKDSMQCEMSTRDKANADASCDGCLEWATIQHDFEEDEDFSSCEIEPRQINKSGCYSKGHRDHLASPDECEALCAQTDGCVAFDYNHKLFNKRCHLCDSFSNKDVNCADGETCKTWGIVQNDKTHGEPKKISYRFNSWMHSDLGKTQQYPCFRDCLQGCKERDGCKAAQFNTDNNECYMSTKDIAAASASCDGCLEWATIEHEFDEDTDFSSCEVEPRQINKSGCWNKGHKDHLAGPDDCEALCAQTDGCVAFDYNHKNFNRRCHLCNRISNTDAACPDGETCKTWGYVQDDKTYGEPKLISYRFNSWSNADLGQWHKKDCFKDCIDGCKETAGCKSVGYSKDDKRCRMSSRETANAPAGCDGCLEWATIEYEDAPECTTSEVEHSDTAMNSSEVTHGSVSDAGVYECVPEEISECGFSIPCGYSFRPGVRTGKDILFMADHTVSKLAAECGKVEGCAGFTTQGWLKSFFSESLEENADDTDECTGVFDKKKGSEGQTQN